MDILSPQSGEESSGLKTQTVTFTDQVTPWVESIGSDPDKSFLAAHVPEISLGEFFERPVKIASFAWGSLQLYQNFNPWSLFFNNPRVVNRICNFNLLHTKLHVRFVVNGGAFYYGRALASYIPLPSFDQFTSLTAFETTNLVGLSQKMHIYLDPSTNQGGDLILPWFHYDNASSIPRGSYDELGSINLQSIVPLQNANGATDVVTISVFAWAEDLTMSIPTIAEPSTLVPQSGDEYGTGPISRPALALAAMAGKLSKVPYVAPYALASQMVAGGVGSLAQLFGYSRPAIISDAIYMKRESVGRMANTNIADSIVKLTYDVKQEVSIDSRTVGLDGSDEMALSKLLEHESYLTQFPWYSINIPEAMLFNVAVTPLLFNRGVLSSTTIHPTMMCAAALPFQFWRGSITFRFQIVACSFHKGRIRIVWEPNSAGDLSEYNVNYNHIVDLGCDRDFSVTVGMGTIQPFLNCSTTRLSTGALPFSSSVGIGPEFGAENGRLAVYVVNELTTPSSNPADIAIMVSVFAEDDFELSSTQSNISNINYFPQSGAIEEAAGASPVNLSIPVLFGKKITASDGAISVMHGDPIVSIRNVLKRYCNHSIMAPPAATTGALSVEFEACAFPSYRGRAPGAVDLTSTSAPTNFVKTTLLSYFTPMFAGYKGGIRQRLVHVGPTIVRGSATITRKADDAETTTVMVLAPHSATSAAKRLNSMSRPDTVSGASIVTTVDGTIAEAEVPYISNRRFVPGRWANKTVANVDIPSQGFVYTSQMSIVPTSIAFVERYVAAGDDFSLFWLQSAPTFVFEPNYPLAL